MLVRKAEARSAKNESVKKFLADVLE